MRSQRTEKTPWIWTAVLTAAAMACIVLAGCTADMPVRWQPSEPQKQAADLTVTDLAALTPHITPGAEPLRAEAEQAAKVTQTYVGLPKQRAISAAPNNAEIIAAAGDVAAQRPTAGQTAQAVLDKAGQVVQTGSSLADLLLTAVAAIAGTYGLGKAGSAIVGLKAGKDAAVAKAQETLIAFGELVGGIDQLPAEMKAAVKSVMANVQSTATERMVAEAKLQ